MTFYLIRRQLKLNSQSQKNIKCSLRYFMTTNSYRKDFPKRSNSTATDSEEIKKKLSTILGEISEPTKHEANQMDQLSQTKKSETFKFSKSSNKTSNADQDKTSSPNSPISDQEEHKSKGAASDFSPNDIFNIKQFLNNVKESDNFKQLQTELNKFYETKWKEQKDVQESLSKRLNYNVKELKSSISIASKVINDLTGYSKVIALKQIIVDNERKLRDLRKEIHKAKELHNEALEQRSRSQKEVNELLEKKNNWIPSDLERFTKIYMNNHELEKRVLETGLTLKTLESKDEETHDNLIKSIMNRYHEEQVWSDKIRQFSTWGTVLIMCINLTLVFLVQLVFEPYKRYRLVNSFEEKVKDLFKDNQKLDLNIQQLKQEMLNSEQKLLTQLEINDDSGAIDKEKTEVFSPVEENITADSNLGLSSVGVPPRVELKFSFESFESNLKFLYFLSKAKTYSLYLSSKAVSDRWKHWLTRLVHWIYPFEHSSTTMLTAPKQELQYYMYSMLSGSLLTGFFIGLMI